MNRRLSAPGVLKVIEVPDALPAALEIDKPV